MLQNFYMIGRDKGRTYWRVLKIDRLDPCELNIREDSTTYTERECSDLLRRIHEGNKSTGGLKFVTTCYGIVGMQGLSVHSYFLINQQHYDGAHIGLLFSGFIKFLGPYYMLLITKRRQIGAICGHTVYAVSKSELIPFLNSTEGSSIANSRNENRSLINSACKCILSMVLVKGTMNVTQLCICLLWKLMFLMWFFQSFFHFNLEGTCNLTLDHILSFIFMHFKVIS